MKEETIQEQIDRIYRRCSALIEERDSLVNAVDVLAVEKGSLREERNMLADENASFANYLTDNGYTQEDVDLIAKGWHGSVYKFIIIKDDV